ncbi:MAG: family oxidoreductase [Sphingomonadales bacterium]|nr:family oxidoreductase [Sphingomonadales bacterium]
MKGLAGKSIIVTGGGSGIGAAVALYLAEEGAKVTVGDVNQQGGETTVQSIEAAGGTAQFIATDVSQEEDVKALVAAAVKAFGKLDGACNAAGVSQRGKAMHEITIEEWDRCHGINLRGMFLCNKYEVLSLLESGGGAIVNIASTVSVVAVQNGAEYCASKSGVMGLVRGAALDYATKGIRVNAVLPGGTLTPMLTSATEQDPGLRKALEDVHPMRRFGAPSEIAGAVLWLLSDDASFVTGSSIAVDGGQLAI